MTVKKEYEKICALCIHSTNIFPSGEFFCDIKGPVSEFGKCSRFYFDALKHKPASAVFPEYEPIMENH